jgi:putative transposase
MGSQTEFGNQKPNRVWEPEKNKALEFGKKVIEVCEAYTSKTVSWTGSLKKVGGSRVIEAGGIKMDRDLNGARGIFLRSLVDSPALMAMLPQCA